MAITIRLVPGGPAVGTRRFLFFPRTSRTGFSLSAFNFGTYTTIGAQGLKLQIQTG